jgi:hypothetical protein
MQKKFILPRPKNTLSISNPDPDPDWIRNLYEVELKKPELEFLDINLTKDLSL